MGIGLTFFTFFTGLQLFELTRSTAGALQAAACDHNLSDQEAVWDQGSARRLGHEIRGVQPVTFVLAAWPCAALQEAFGDAMEVRAIPA